MIIHLIRPLEIGGTKSRTGDRLFQIKITLFKSVPENLTKLVSLPDLKTNKCYICTLIRTFDMNEF